MVAARLKAVSLLARTVIWRTDPMFVNGSVTLDGTLSLQVNPDISGSDTELIATGNVTEGGLLDVTATNGDPFTAGEMYNLISANSFFDVFTSIELPTLGAGLTWNLTQSNNDLLLSVANLPEPAPLALIAIGGMGLLLRGRKKKA